MRKTKKKEIVDPLEEAKLLHLPDMIDIHSMKCNSFELRNDPVELSYTDGTKQVIRVESDLTFKLMDAKNRIDVTITVHRTYYK